MKLLLDTQIFIWWDSDLARLPARMLNLIEDEANTLVLSVISLWEIQIKAQLGKLDLNRSLESIVRDQQQTNRMQILSVDAAHVFGLAELPFHHKDPFDRLLIAQALVEGLSIVSVDPVFVRYPVTVLSS